MSDVRMCAIFRVDLPLPAGKMAAQAGHAFLSAWQRATPNARLVYDLSAQPKLVLLAPDEAALRRIQGKAKERGVAHALITDAAKTVLPAPAVTVLGLGPMSRADYNSLTRGLRLA